MRGPAHVMLRPCRWPPLPDDDLAPLVDLLSGRRFVALTGAGCSTESGIPDYRGGGRTGPRNPIQHDAFMKQADVRRRYWARATLGWARFSGAEPNAAHRALAALEAAGTLAGVITQNVDRLHQRAGSRRVVELHGALADVACLRCGRGEPRHELQARLLDANPGWLESGRRHPARRRRRARRRARRGLRGGRLPPVRRRAEARRRVLRRLRVGADARGGVGSVRRGGGAAGRRLVAGRLLGLSLRAPRAGDRRCRSRSSTSARRAPTTSPP